jgi:hypothetical protein
MQLSHPHLAAVRQPHKRPDAYLGEERVQAVHLLPLLNKRIVLRDTLECQLVHEVDDVRLAQPAVLEVLDSDWERGGVEHDLAVAWQEANELLNDRLEFRRQQLVRLHTKSTTRRLCE